jgi:hypothetical protein
MVRGWLIFSTLVLGVMFKLWKDYQGVATFPFSDKTLPMQSWIYFFMEHINAMCIGACLIIADDTPKWLLWLYFYILAMDLFHYMMFFRDEGIGFNLAKTILFGLPLTWIQLKRLYS